MSVKKKLYLMGICIGIILIVISVNVVRKLKDSDEPGQVTVKENVITRAEAYRLLSYLEYNKTEREAISIRITYQEDKMSGWYDTYINALFNMGLIESKVTTNPESAMTYGACKELMDKLILKYPNYQTAYASLSFQFTDSEKDMLIADFLELYQALLAALPDEDKRIKEETLLVLGRQATEEGEDRMVTDLGKFYYQDAKSYENSTVRTSLSLIDQYVDKGIKAFVCDQEIIYVTGLATEKIVVHNVWIKQATGLSADTFINGIDKSFSTVSELKSTIEKVVGDITVENGKIVKINVKPDMIQGKVLRSGDDYIEIEGYGKVPLEENFRIYKIYGELSEEPTGSILVGYDNTDFVVSDGKISAALITESIKAENIRVLIKTTGYNDIYHDNVEFTATSDFTVKTKTTEKTYKEGDKVTIKPNDKLFDDGRITVKAASENARIELMSIERSYGNPKYRGSLEMAEDNGKIIIVNELPMEEYLYSVVPSEMPTSYGIEAIKVQAVCARSYAYRHLMANSLSRYGAHVDDSASYQVYNNVAENEDSILAVKDTYGQVIKYGDEIIMAYYYSTSCGHSTGPTGVWANGKEQPYLNSKLLLAGKNGETIEAQSASANKYEDLSSEKNFKSFLEATDVTTYDSEFSWYRWKVTMSIQDIQKVIDSRLADRYHSNPDLILTMTDKSGAGKDAVYESLPVDTVGDITNISVLKRENSGIVSELLITGSEHTIKVLTDYNIRALLAPIYDNIIRQDESEIKNLSMLPSSFFFIKRKETKGKLTGFTLKGGGYGHGIGMSQNAVKAMVDTGMDYKRIIAYFYEGTELGAIYE